MLQKNDLSVEMKHFDQYYKLISSGKINVCERVIKQINRVIGYKSKYDFHQKRADSRIRFMEHECSHTKGKRGNLKLALPQRVWLEVSWGFYFDKELSKTNLETMEDETVFDERRLTNETAIIVPRGTGKTTMASGIGKTMQIADGEHGASVQIIAPTREQASECFDASRAMNTFDESIFYKLVENDLLRSTKRGEFFSPTNSLFSIKTLDYDTMDGSNNHVNMFDEIHSMTVDPIQIMNHGSQMKRDNWQSYYISTFGTLRGYVFDDYLKLWDSILDGEVVNDSIQIWIYSLDDIEEIHNPDVWDKALPLLGVTYQKSDIQKMLELAKSNPVKQAEIMAKIFNLPVNNYLSYFTNEECASSPELFDKSSFIGSDYENVRAVLGIDLSDVNDICSISFQVEKDGGFHYYSRKYVPRATVDNLPKSQRDKYEEWYRNGYIVIHDNDYNDQDYIFDDLVSFMSENKITPVLIGYDPWHAKALVKRFESYYGDVMYSVPQTVKNLSPNLKIYKSLMTSKKIIYDDPISEWCHANVMVKLDANNNIFPNKAKAKDKIDVFASQLIAFITFEQNKELFESYYY